jgi:multidrug efflux pump subunit AcrA (membrane-fusion protein)
MWFTHRKAFLGVSLVSVLVIGAAIAAIMAAGPGTDHPGTAGSEGLQGEPPDGGDSAISVKTIRPRRNPSFSFSATQPAYVEAYYRNDLEAQVAGRIGFLRKDIGSPVAKGERLIKIEVPDLDKEVEQKEAMMKRGRVAQKLAEKQVPIAEAAAEAALHNIAQKQAEADEAKYTMEFRELELRRIRIMVQSNTVYREVEDEKDRNYKAARSAYESAQVAVKKANADYKEAQAKVEAAIADVELKKALVEVAEKERDKAKALADYSEITAPFNGVITRRRVDPGSFVQNATTAHTEPLMTVERTDIVTVYMRLPDTYATYVDEKTEALIEMSELSGLLIHAKVTRRPPSLNEKDRRMRVEVDLYNGTEEEYHRFLTDEKRKKKPFDDLKEGPLPLPLKVTGKNVGTQPQRLLPGMVGKMTLVFQKIEAYLVPSSAVFSQGGKPYIYEVKDGIAHLVPVEIQVDDGKLAKVSRIVRVGEEEIKQDLTGDEEIVFSNQGELSEGQAVRTTRVEW